MRRRLVLPLLVLLTAPAVATTMLALSTEELYRSAHVVAVVRVGSLETVQAKGRLTTLARLVVEEGVKGAAAGDEVLARIPGGSAGDWVQSVPGAPKLVEGERCVVFLEDAGGGGYRFVGLEQGKFDVASAPGAPPSVVRRAPSSRLVVRDPSGRLVDTGAAEGSEPLDAFLARLRRLGAGR